MQTLPPHSYVVDKPIPTDAELAQAREYYRDSAHAAAFYELTLDEMVERYAQALAQYRTEREVYAARSAGLPKFTSEDFIGPRFTAGAARGYMERFADEMTLKREHAAAAAIRRFLDDQTRADAFRSARRVWNWRSPAPRPRARARRSRRVVRARGARKSSDPEGSSSRAIRRAS